MALPVLYLEAIAHLPRAQRKFWSKVERSDECWLWTGAKGPSGHAQTSLLIDNAWRSFNVNRVAFLLTRGFLDPKQSIIQTCRNRACVRPDHLVECSPLERGAITLRGRVRGNYVSTDPLHNERFLARFWSRVEKGESCWLWTGTRNRHGYGIITHGYPNILFSALAHRISYALTYGEFANGWKVCHTCDTPACVNSAHLFLGTQGDNTQDMIAKGRGTDGSMAAKGERQHSAKLTESIVCDIRRRSADGETQPSIAAVVGVHQATISKIVLRKTWRHIA